MFVGLAVIIFNMLLSFVNLDVRWLSFAYGLVRSRSRSTSVCNGPHYGEALQKRRMPNLRKPPCGRDPDLGWLLGQGACIWHVSRDAILVKAS